SVRRSTNGSRLYLARLPPDRPRDCRFVLLRHGQGRLGQPEKPTGARRTRSRPRPHSSHVLRTELNRRICRHQHPSFGIRAGRRRAHPLAFVSGDTPSPGSGAPADDGRKGVSEAVSGSLTVGQLTRVELVARHVQTTFVEGTQGRPRCPSDVAPSCLQLLTI